MHRGITDSNAAGIYTKVSFYEAEIPVKMTVFWRRPILDKLRFSTRNFGKNPVLIFLVTVLIAVSSFAQDASTSQAKGDKDKVVRQVVDNWMQIGNDQFKQGYYSAAEKSFLRAKDYEAYLSSEERDKLNDSLQKAHKAAQERETSAQPVVTEMSKPVAQQPVNSAAEVKAAAEPEPVPAPAAAPVSAPMPVTSKAQAPAASMPVESTSLSAAPESDSQQAGYIGVINRRKNVIRGMVKAVVNDASDKAQTAMSQGQFDKAKDAVESAQKVVFDNQQAIGDYLFNQYTGQLQQLSDRIAQGEKLQAQQKEDDKRIKASRPSRNTRTICPRNAKKESSTCLETPVISKNS